MHRFHCTFAMAVTAATMIALAAPAAAEEVVVKHQIEKDVPRVEVRYGDLNLDSEAGRDRLTNRLDSAVRKVCGSADFRDLPAFGGMMT